MAVLTVVVDLPEGPGDGDEGEDPNETEGRKVGEGFEEAVGGGDDTGYASRKDDGFGLDEALKFIDAIEIAAVGPHAVGDGEGGNEGDEDVPVGVGKDVVDEDDGAEKDDDVDDGSGGEPLEILLGNLFLFHVTSVGCL